MFYPENVHENSIKGMKDIGRYSGGMQRSQVENGREQGRLGYVQWRDGLA